MTDAQLAAAKQKYTRSTSSSVTGGVVSSLFLGTFAILSITAASAAASNAALKLDIINTEMRKPRRQRQSTRVRDLFGGAAISVANAGLGHHVSHIANHIFSQTTAHTLTQSQSLVATGAGEGAQHKEFYMHGCKYLE